MTSLGSMSRAPYLAGSICGRVGALLEGLRAQSCRRGLGDKGWVVGMAVVAVAVVCMLMFCLEARGRFRCRTLCYTGEGK